jgi:hypothetical protein
MRTTRRTKFSTLISTNLSGKQAGSSLLTMEDYHTNRFFQMVWEQLILASKQCFFDVTSVFLTSAHSLYSRKVLLIEMCPKPA